MNYRLTLQYDGTDFHGWQRQDGQRTVQGELARALSLLEGREVVVHGSGRTDAGVHAEGQVASAQLRREMPPWKLLAALNGNLASDLRVIKAEVAADDFHARFSARGKTYLYRIINAPVASPFWSRYAYQDARRLDVERMSEAARLFLGEHDWTAFSAAQTDAESRVRTVTEMCVAERYDERAAARLIEIKASAGGFLRYMVRSIAGALLAAGRGQLDLPDVARAIESGTRPLAIVTAPAHGLTLLSVHYD
ncbi:MAG: tRNA pseudouridine38-40 synthase [Blastocatellia bacterium]|jgi:tRNA pseudouridine38-40 synthase|nr:tRNA pseudouridine38-40 synthase [Blastocatellia bacterium]